MYPTVAPAPTTAPSTTASTQTDTPGPIITEPPTTTTEPDGKSIFERSICLLDHITLIKVGSENLFSIGQIGQPVV